MGNNPKNRKCDSRYKEFPDRVLGEIGIALWYDERHYYTSRGHTIKKTWMVYTRVSRLRLAFFALGLSPKLDTINLEYRDWYDAGFSTNGLNALRFSNQCARAARA
jgi:hypothetical protein